MFVREAEADANFRSRKNYSIEREKNNDGASNHV